MVIPALHAKKLSLPKKSSVPNNSERRPAWIHAKKNNMVATRKENCSCVSEEAHAVQTTGGSDGGDRSR